MTEKEFLKAYDELSDALFRHCFFRTYDRERAHDLVQETFTKTWEYLIEGRQVLNLRAFLYRVATNLIIDESRKRATVSLDELQAVGFDPASTDHTHMAMAAEAAEALRHLDKLSEEYRQVLIMRYVDGLKPKEIAEVTGETANVISVRLHRATQALKVLITKNV